MHRQHKEEFHCISEIDARIEQKFLIGGRPTEQSSTDGGASGLAVDSNEDTNYASGSCTQTGPETQPWWSVDLEFIEWVTRLDILNRGDEHCKYKSDKSLHANASFTCSSTCLRPWNSRNLIFTLCLGVCCKLVDVFINLNDKIIKIMLQ